MSYFKRVQEKFGLVRVFEVGPYNRFEHGKRFELSGSICSASNSVEKLTLINKVLTEVRSLLEQEFLDSGFYIVLKFEEFSHNMDLSLDDIFQQINVVNFHVIENISYEDKENELFVFLFLIELNSNSIEPLIKAFLARHIDLEPYIMADLFFISKDSRKYANLYDDRGIDFIDI